MESHLEQVSVEIEENRVFLLGHIDERTNPEVWSELLAPVLKSQDYIHLHWEEVNMMNSSGVLAWLRFLKMHDVALVYQGCPPWLVGLFNSVGGFFPRPNIGVGSLFVPYFDLDIDDSEQVSMIIGSEVPLLLNYESMDGISLLKGRHMYDRRNVQPDFEPQRYFKFLVTHHEQFSKILMDISRSESTEP